jgi:hypothetical protein
VAEKKEEKKSSPTDDKAKSEKTSEDEKPPIIDRLIERSPEPARIILFASNSFLSDTVLNLASGGMARNISTVNLVKNALTGLWRIAACSASEEGRIIPEPCSLESKCPGVLGIFELRFGRTGAFHRLADPSLDHCQNQASLSPVLNPEGV